LVIPSEIREKYGMRKGDRFEVNEMEGAILLKPLPRNPLLELRGKLRGDRSLVDDLLRDRALEREKEDRELGLPVRPR